MPSCRRPGGGGGGRRTDRHSEESRAHHSQRERPAHPSNTKELGRVGTGRVRAEPGQTEPGHGKSRAEPEALRQMVAIWRANMNKCKLPERGRTRRSLVADYPVCWRSSGLVWTSAGEMGAVGRRWGEGGPACLHAYARFKEEYSICRCHYEKMPNSA